MEFYRTLDLTLISANGLKDTSFTGKMDVFVVASISGSHQKLTTSVDNCRGTNPTWNFPMKLTVNETSSDTLVIKIKAVGWFVNTELGQIRVPIIYLTKGVNKHQGNAVSFPVIRKWSRKPKGSLTFSYKFGETYSREPFPVKISGGKYYQKPPPGATISQGRAKKKKRSSNNGIVVADGVCGGGGGGGGCGGGGSC